MALPCVKFISHFASYLAFLCMIISSSVRFAYDESNSKSIATTRFQCQFTKYFSNFSEYTNRSDLAYKPDFYDFYIRPTRPSGLDLVISIWVIGNFISFSTLYLARYLSNYIHTLYIGQAWHEIKKLFENGIYEYLFSSLNVLTFSLNILYIASFSLKYYTMWLVSKEIGNLEKESFWSNLKKLKDNDTHMQKDVYETFYWLNRGNKRI